MRVLRIPPSPALRRWSQQHGYNPELVARWGAFYPDVGKLLEAMERPPPVFIRLNGLRGSPKDTLRSLEAKEFKLQPAGPPGSYAVLEQPMSVGATEEYLQGRYYVQDASSTLAPLALDPRPGETIADLCAAPGGKTVHIADQTRGESAIFAFELTPERARSLVSNLNRCGVDGAIVFAQPAQEATRLGIEFDRVLIDAPCTGEGVLQRDPSRRQGHLGEYEACAKAQSELLRTAHSILKPGGIAVYSTCTLAPEENELQVAGAMEMGFEVEALPAVVQELRMGGNALVPGVTSIPEQTVPPEVARTAHALPHLHGCLGFYVARLRKVAG